MLVLTRHIDQKIIIGDNIAITVLGINGNHVRLGFQAPINVSIHREEIHIRIQNEKENDMAEKK